jgi:LuxR family transcriptional regulator, regulator of acetate metabolism
VSTVYRKPPNLAAPELDEGVTLAGIAAALRSLRQASTAAALFRLAARSLCDEAGFVRASVFSRRDQALTAASACARRDSAGGDRLWPEVAGEPVPLRPWLHESEALRRRSAVLVADAAGDARALALLPGAESYVIAPITCRGEAVALIHADHGAGGSVSEVDRVGLWAFSEALSHALERCTLEERLRRHSQRVLALVRSTEASVEELVDPTGELPPSGHDGVAAQHHALPGRARLETLTPREHEVLAMLAEGETNAGIAQRLVVSEDTVKTHVKHILRKLEVRNRSQAVSRYFRTEGGRSDGELATWPAGAG